ncbi:hypothetical protein [Bacteroides ovatus]|uniref:hypothetical protein n=1 Tax=Bacteroides ovatus TaxID=28116 RepID=UPI001F3B5987|nr:hypothetical protein [Bacteroides ovatus]
MSIPNISLARRRPFFRCQRHLCPCSARFPERERWKSTGAMTVQRKPSFSAIYRTRYTIRSTAVCATSAKSDGLPMPRSAISTGAA